MQIYKLFSEVETFFKNNIGKTAFKGLLFGINDGVRFDYLEEFTEYIGFPNRQPVQKFLSDNELLTKIRNSNCLKLCA